MTPADKRAAAPYLVTAIASRLLVFVAIGAAIVAGIRYGPAAGLAALALGVWVARLARAPLPPSLRDKL